MTNYYKISRDSGLGRQFTNLEKQGEEINKRLKEVEAKYGFDGWYIGGRCAEGGVVAVIFPEGKTKSGEEIDTKKVWKRGDCGYNTFAPRARGEGAKIEKELKDCGQITRFDYNELMNVNDPFHLIGVALGSEEWIGVSLDKNKSKKIPDDAVEITGSEYEELFKIDQP